MKDEFRCSVVQGDKTEAYEFDDFLQMAFPP